MTKTCQKNDKTCFKQAWQKNDKKCQKCKNTKMTNTNVEKMSKNDKK